MLDLEKLEKDFDQWLENLTPSEMISDLQDIRLRNAMRTMAVYMLGPEAGSDSDIVGSYTATLVDIAKKYKCNTLGSDEEE